MDGTNSTNGKRLVGIDHLRQSIRDILTTPLGSRVMRREYGSRIFDLIDAPMNRTTLMQIYAETVSAIQRWEPRFKTTSVVATSAQPGLVELELTGKYLPNGEEVTLSGIIVQ